MAFLAGRGENYVYAQTRSLKTPMPVARFRAREPPIGGSIGPGKEHQTSRPLPPEPRTSPIDGIFAWACFGRYLVRHALPIDQSGGQMDILAGHARGVTAQMTYWTYVWVVRPLVVIAFALIRYIAGHGTWSAVLRGHGETPYEVRWVGPQGQQRWSVNYVQDQLHG